MNIVQASPEQAGELTQISIAAKTHWGYSRDVLLSWEFALTITPESIVVNPTFIAMLDGAIAGFYQINMEASSASLEHLWVLPVCMRKGVGSALLQHAVQQVKKPLLIDSDPNAEAFYLACGARRVGQVPAPIPDEPERFLPRLELHVQNLSHRKPAFFYGLFMDEALLRGKGMNPTCFDIAWVDGFGLRIGERASLVKAKGERAYGLIVFLNAEELEALYAEESVSDYLPEKLSVTTSNNQRLVAIAYNLPVDKLTGQNRQYAGCLAELAKNVGLPVEYIEEIKTWAI